jgi:DNA-binding IclR family transcriptional regulator
MDIHGTAPVKARKSSARPAAAGRDRRDMRSVASVERACDVLAVICADAGRTQGVKELSQALGLSMSTVHRLLAALVNKGFVQQEEGSRKYRIGPKILDFTLNYLRRLDLRDIALPHMQRLRDMTGETVTVSMRDGKWRIYLAQIESPQEIRQTVDIGKRVPLHVGGSGKAILAFLDDAEREDYLAQPDLAPAVGGPVDVGWLRQELAEVRRRGYASSRSERLPNAASVAAPIRDFRGQVVGCLSISGPVWRFTDELIAQFGPLAKQTAAEISRSLGAPARVEW